MISRGVTRAAWCVALVALCAALVLFNRPGAPEPAPAATPDPLAAYVSDAPPGHEPGQRLPEFTLTQTDGAPFALSEHRGQVTVLNLWATWCTPCVNELPHFDRLQRAYGDQVAVLAIHSDLITDDVAAYLANYDYGIAFAVDEDGQVIASMGGSTMLPQTMVLDRFGVVTYNQVGSVSYEALEELVNAAMADEP